MLDVAVIGCGIVGANVAYLLSQHKLRAAVFEKENDVSMGTTRANSAIVHAGYDPEPGTAMARLNVRGSALTKEQCAAFDVKYRQIGSLVLAFSDEEMATVRRLYENGVANGVPGVRVLTREETLAMEPNLSDAVCGALYAPSAAIVEPWDLALALVAGAGVTLEKKESFVHTRTKKRFNEMTPQQKAEAIRENPLYGRVICRCETVTEGEIVDALHRPIPPRTIDGVKRRCTAGMGRCQGGFCGPRVHEIIARELGIPQQDVLKDRAGSYIITGTTKEGGLHHGE